MRWRTSVKHSPTEARAGAPTRGPWDAVNPADAGVFPARAGGARYGWGPCEALKCSRTSCSRRQCRRGLGSCETACRRCAPGCAGSGGRYWRPPGYSKVLRWARCPCGTRASRHRIGECDAECGDLRSPAASSNWLRRLAYARGRPRDGSQSGIATTRWRAGRVRWRPESAILRRREGV